MWQKDRATAHQGTAWQKFFKGTGKHPQFHKFGERDSFRLTGSVYIGRDFVQLPSLGKVKLKEKDYDTLFAHRI